MNSVNIISGPLGVGKSSLTHLINKKLGYALVDGDVMFVPLENVKHLEWHDRLKITWNNIVDITKNYLDNDLDVVIDFVVEDELAWIRKKLSNYDITIRYVVLVAGEDVIKKRLEKRGGGLQYLDRSLALLNQLKNKKQNKKFVLDTSGKTNEEVFQIFTSSNRFKL